MTAPLAWFRFFNEVGFESSMKEEAIAKWARIIEDSIMYKAELNETRLLDAYWKSLEKCEKRKTKHSWETFCRYLGDDNPVSAYTRKSPGSMSSVSSYRSTKLQKIAGWARTISSKTRFMFAKPENLPRGKLEAPWDKMMESLMTMHRCHKNRVPALSTGKDIRKPGLKGLWKQAHVNLTTYAGDSGNELSRNDASVALSCTLNTQSHRVNDHFEDGFVSKAKAGWVFPRNLSLSETTISRTSTIRGGMREVYLSMLELREGALDKEDEERQFQEMIGYSGRNVGITYQLVLRPSFGSKPAEADHVQYWKDVFNHLLEDSGIFMQSGECVSESSKAAKLVLQQDYHDAGSHGRKVDLLFYAGELELSIFEFKSKRTCSKELKKQINKCIRLNRAIMEYCHNLRTGQRIPIPFMTFHGWTGQLHLLYEYEGIFVARPEGAPITLPTTIPEFEKFLENNALDILFDIMGYLKQMVSQLATPVATPVAAPLAAPVALEECRKIDTSVFLTPQRSQSPSPE
ncbi:MAG: hypothetical protein J3Q66DRAFT_358985 [Benniella sp.]|nr:MAG: hypothetical protein J3Q66DRAFT_358985 [Benniella sp.]